MNELTTFFQDDLVGVFKNDAVTTSLRVAEVFEKGHNHVLRAIKNLLAGLPKNGQTPQRWSTSPKMGALKCYQDSYGRNPKGGRPAAVEVHCSL